MVSATPLSQSPWEVAVNSSNALKSDSSLLCASTCMGVCLAFGCFKQHHSSSSRLCRSVLDFYIFINPKYCVQEQLCQDAPVTNTAGSSFSSECKRLHPVLLTVVAKDRPAVCTDIRTAKSCASAIANLPITSFDADRRSAKASYRSVLISS